MSGPRATAILPLLACGAFFLPGGAAFASTGLLTSERAPLGRSASSLPLRAGAPGVALGRHTRGRGGVVSVACNAREAEKLLLETLGATKGRGQKASKEQLQAIGSAISALEADGGIKDPVLSPAILGSWELLYTSKSNFDISNPLGARVDGSAPGVEAVFRAVAGKESDVVASSSPIQRTVTSIDSIKITQDIDLDPATARVDQKVSISDSVYLRLSASASTSPEASKRRIDFTFDLAYFQLGPIRIPYPVPFKLLGKEAMGWLDITYLSDSLRISCGNKGTTFVLGRPAKE